jgi:site-specific DNA-cytosine methylase
MFVDFRHGTVGEVAPTLQAKDQGGYSLNYLPGVLTWVKARNAMTEDGRGMEKEQNGLGVPSPPAVALPDLVVRRLLPVECERLQGLPDDHTRWKVDEKTGSTVEQSDSARYKQCGNGLAVPVMEWIVDGILALVAEEEK